MAFFISNASKLERAMRAMFILKNLGTWGNTYISNQSLDKDRTLPNRTFVVRSFSPTKPYRPEGVCQLEIQHHFDATVQPGTDPLAPRVNLDSFLGDTLDLLNIGGGTDYTDLQALATTITQAGRWLAANNPNGNSAEDLKIINANLDMVNFRCDNVKFSTPFLTRGNDTSTTNWVEIVHLSAFISHASN